MTNQIEVRTAYFSINIETKFRFMMNITKKTKFIYESEILTQARIKSFS